MALPARLLSTLAVTAACVGAGAWVGCTPARPQARSTLPLQPALSPSVTQSPASAEASFALHPDALRALGAPEKLVRRLAKSPFAYFRRLSGAYELRTCRTFHDQARELPLVVVHGDAHLEQFVATAHTYGLEDFDRAGFGPAVVDLVRYAASLHIACAEAGFECDAPAAIEGFLDAYRDALSAPPRRGVPSVVANLRERAPTETGPWLSWVESLMQPLPPEDVEPARAGLARFGTLMQAVHEELPTGELDIVKLGRLRMGIGSALERKLLFRVTGPSAAPDDDLVIEAREGSPPTPGSCVWRPESGQPLVLLFAAVLGRRLPELYGVVPMFDAEQSFYVQSWDPGYVELELDDVRSQGQLLGLAIDAGYQLGGYLWERYPASLRHYQAHAQRDALDATRSRAVTLAGELADETLVEWRDYRASLDGE